MRDIIISESVATVGNGIRAECTKCENSLYYPCLYGSISLQRAIDDISKDGWRLLDQDSLTLVCKECIGTGKNS